ncbi:MAG: YggU family protein [Candidatus Nomurabacteria bacterium GW2011_GWF2_43_8]|uniref:YggU family protein n=3 Tax=Candidatus Nomuraibacteriota TaxID=1752729 RepID=A0A0G1FJX7_9BACT|nr:MAG: YggU family protein [Candidatus Nomurabacteria bacterium GW2011_GWA2_43_15]KKT19270.1 MAG: YggU family protein [Candidatus Nomurabacteria bacterium GW2011_GWB1_43_7]KKT22303.1 MAG: YggU family protein [Candidatus Nomurabacteria bacterium GW2011_GWF2_43_8]
MRYLHVKVSAGARRESFKQKSEDHFEISVREKAERNLANARVLELVASHFKVSVNKVRIVNGHHHPSKLLVVEN